jgi:hypothetical protein
LVLGSLDVVSIFNRIMRYAKAPQGRRMISQAGRYARSPQARRQFDQVRRQITGRRAGRPR